MEKLHRTAGDRQGYSRGPLSLEQLEQHTQRCLWLRRRRYADTDDLAALREMSHRLERLHAALERHENGAAGQGSDPSTFGGHSR
jgi:hypothetical protein